MVRLIFGIMKRFALVQKVIDSRDVISQCETRKRKTHISELYSTTPMCIVIRVFVTIALHIALAGVKPFGLLSPISLQVLSILQVVDEASQSAELSIGAEGSSPSDYHFDPPLF